MTCFPSTAINLGTLGPQMSRSTSPTYRTGKKNSTIASCKRCHGLIVSLLDPKLNDPGQDLARVIT